MTGLLNPLMLTHTWFVGWLLMLFSELQLMGLALIARWALDGQLDDC